jgi:hypothetical protein
VLYLGLRQLEWLFFSCHNYWIVCHLVKDDDCPFLAYSPKISIRDSSEPFQAFLGAILSVVKGVSVESSTFNPHMELDTVLEEEDDGSSPEDDIDDGSKMYRGGSSKGTATEPLTMRSCHRAGHGNIESLMVRWFAYHLTFITHMHYCSDYFFFPQLG